MDGTAGDNYAVCSQHTWTLITSRTDVFLLFMVQRLTYGRLADLVQQDVQQDLMDGKVSC